MAAEMTPPAAAPAFLTRAGWGSARIEPLAGDASFRRYFRVIEPNRRAVLMDAPPPHEDPRPFIGIARHLCALGFAAPSIFAEDLDHGLVLLEDFGDARMREAVDAGDVDETATYAATVALLADLHRHPPADVPPYARKELHREAGLLIEWYCPAIGLAVDAKAYHGAWDAAFDRIDDAAHVTVLRDYHAENIMLRAGLSGIARLGLLDFQDALVGHPAYDLVSMLQDARRDVPLDIETKMLVEYQRLAAPGPAFLDSYAILGAQRNAKIVGIFTRLWKRDGKPRYLDFLPRVWGYLERDLAHPALAEVRTWFDSNIPADKRGGYLKDPA
jgi:aminoglycoside/choline kinase family phosphotransferase